MSAIAGERTIREVEALYYDYAAAIDEEVERWPDLFSGDARYRVMSRENFDRNLPLAPIYCEGRGMIRRPRDGRSRNDRLRHALHAPRDHERAA